MILSVGLFQACQHDPRELEEMMRAYRPDLETALDVEILYSDSAQVKVRITGPRMLQYLDRDNPRQEFPDGVKVQFFGEEGEVSGVLTAKYGIRYEREDEVEVQDSVVWEGEGRQKLETEKLVWDSREKKIRTDRFVVITRPNYKIYGHGFVAEQDFSNARILAPEGRINFPADKAPGPAQESDPGQPN
jgi:LPS export ABC transporter protein LptC